MLSTSALRSGTQSSTKDLGSNLIERDVSRQCQRCDLLNPDLVDTIRRNPVHGIQKAYHRRCHQRDQVCAGLWEQAELLGRLEQRLGVEPRDKATAQVHRWLATDMGRGPRPSTRQTKHETWRLSHLSTKPPVRCCCARTTRRSRCHELLDTGDIAKEDLDSRPLFDRLRGQGQLEGGNNPAAGNVLQACIAARDDAGRLESRADGAEALGEE
jgi:hypothetical protein